MNPSAVLPNSPAVHPYSPPPEAQKSIDVDSEAEIARHKWIQSEKAGRDLGESAICQWVQEHWWGYLRARWMEHLQGKCYWIELDRCDYGILDRDFQDRKELLNRIVEWLKDGKENLDILDWAIQNHLPRDPVIEILTAVDINSCRLICKFDTFSRETAAN